MTSFRFSFWWGEVCFLFWMFIFSRASNSLNCYYIECEVYKPKFTYSSNLRLLCLYKMAASFVAPWLGPGFLTHAQSYAAWLSRKLFIIFNNQLWLASDLALAEVMFVFFSECLYFQRLAFPKQLQIRIAVSYKPKFTSSSDLRLLCLYKMSASFVAPWLGPGFLTHAQSFAAWLSRKSVYYI